MHLEVKAKIHKETSQGTILRVLAPHVSLTGRLERYSEDGILRGELRIDDGRTITAEQRKRAYAALMYRRCVICGKKGEIHHEDAVGPAVCPRAN